MRVLVTGGAGFIGSHLASRLVGDGHEVRVLDNFSTGSRSNLARIADSVDLVEGDIQSYERAHNAVKGCDVVFHQAALPSVPRSIQDPLTSTAINVTGTLNLLLASRDSGVRRVVYASSSSIYGADPTLPKSEDLAPRPISPYAVAKLASEGYCRSFAEVYGLETVAIRYFNVFGPGQDPLSQYAAVIPRFITALLEGQAPVVFGDGEQSRDFTYIDNVVEANLLAARAEGASGQAFNIACGERISLNRLLDDLREIIGIDIEASYLESRPGDVKHSLADISRARGQLGYEPLVAFSDGLRRTVEHLQGEIREGNPRITGSTLSRMPLALEVYGGGEVPPEVERLFFAKLRLPNGTWKTTYPNRLDDVNHWLRERLPKCERLEIMDVAVSSGVSSAEWSDDLSANGFAHRLVAGDLLTEGWLTSWGDRIAILFDASEREPILLEVGPLTVPVRSDRRPVRLARPVLSPLLRAAVSRVRRLPPGQAVHGGLVRRPISLVAAELRRRPGVEVVCDDVTVPGRFPAAFDVVRAANLVQPSYFDESTLKRVVANLRDRVREDGLLLIVRTGEDRTNRATIFRREGGHLREESSLNGGSEISDLVLAL